MCVSHFVTLLRFQHLCFLPVVSYVLLVLACFWFLLTCSHLSHGFSLCLALWQGRARTTFILCSALHLAPVCTCGVANMHVSISLWSCAFCLVDLWIMWCVSQLCCFGSAIIVSSIYLFCLGLPKSVRHLAVGRNPENYHFGRNRMLLAFLLIPPTALN